MLGLVGCTGISTSLNRHPASQYPEIHSDLYESTKALNAFFQQESLDVDTCEVYLNDSYEFLASLDSDYFKTDYTAEEHESILNYLWQIRANIRGHMQSWSHGDVLSAECTKAIKDINRAMRYLDDYVGLKYIQLKEKEISGFENEDKSAMFSRPFPWSVTTQKTFDSKLDLKTGDVLLWRSTTTVSAAIARIGDVQNSFAHLSIIYVDPKTHKRYNIESLIETGLIVKESQGESEEQNYAKALNLYSSLVGILTMARTMKDPVKAREILKSGGEFLLEQFAG